jgi:hypothetical protein
MNAAGIQKRGWTGTVIALAAAAAIGAGATAGGYQALGTGSPHRAKPERHVQPVRLARHRLHTLPVAPAGLVQSTGGTDTCLGTGAMHAC